MKKLLTATVVLAAIAIAPASAANAADTCPPGTTNPVYCLPQVPAAATDNAKAAQKAISKTTAKKVAKAGGIVFNVDAAGPGTVQVRVFAKLKKSSKSKKAVTTLVASYKAGFKSASANIKIKAGLTKAGKSALKKQKSSLTLSIESKFTPTVGNSASKKTSQKLKP
jgi:hypothetical protein